MDQELRAALDRDMRAAFERAEIEYIYAKEAGLSDPVIIFRDTINGLGEDDPERHRLESEHAITGLMPMQVAWQERADTIRELAHMPEATAMVRTPRPGYRMTVLYEANGGLTIHDCLAPGDQT